MPPTRAAFQIQQQLERSRLLVSVKRGSDKLLALAEHIIKKPSRSKYRGLFALAITLDVIDLAEVTVIGWIPVLFLKLFGIILFFAGWGANSRIKAIDKIHGSLSRHSHQLMQRVLWLSQTGRGKGVAGKLLRKPARKLFLKLRIARTRRLLKRNPFIKNTLAIIADLIPILDLLPWRTLGIYLTYKDELKAYEEAQPLLESYKEAKENELEMVQDQAMAEAEAIQAQEQAVMAGQEAELQEAT